MTSIFVGFLFIFLDFNINMGSSVIDLIPDFIGYIIMLRGTAELTAQSPRFGMVRPFITAMAVYTAVLFILGFLGASADGDSVFVIIGIILQLVALGFSIYISYCIVMGIRDIENTKMCDLHGARLFSIWRLQSILSVIVYLLMFIPALAIICVIVGFIVAVCFLVVFNRSRKLYYSQIW